MSLQMRDLLENLKNLQGLDLEIRKLNKEQDRWPAILGMRDKEVEARLREQNSLEEAQKKFRAEVRQKELELITLEESIVKLNVTLNTVKTNKEYTAVLNEIALKKSHISDFEEEILERLEKAEELQKEVDAATAAVDAARLAYEKLAMQAESEKREILAEREELEERREAYRKELPEDILEQYGRIAEGRDGLAVVTVVDGVCQGCYINLTLQEINLLMAPKNIICCKSCSRILYLEE